MTKSSPERDGRTTRFEARRPELLTQATEHLLEHGVAAFSLRPVAKALGVTHATLLRHFTSKEQLLVEVAELARAELQEKLQADPDLQAASGAEEVVRATWRILRTPREVRRIAVLLELANAHPADETQRRSIASELIADWIAEMQEVLIADGYSKEQSVSIGTLLVGLAHGLQIDLAITGDTERIDAAFESGVPRILSR
ncbi:TetR/AcrR family transcriptional regulator [Pseudoclavibacter sp. AY1F1]|uniref:TetR/AcrR family transcriptional regulator n=1 Tax=Pseudoclavibacter sp. AY1F1 TaxID=2080583 RepID=UPI0015E2F4C8|nr:TetR/AcrR family transcriptional regulator [Pseudoclavibacter sp. AY1F1]